MLIKVKVFPGSKKEEIIKKTEDSLDVKVKARPEKNEANRAVVTVLADYFKIPAGKIRMIKGSKQRNKIFDIILE